ncbi:MAG TPA: hypothetical protein PKX00_05705 [Opitutaceae bacterium]|nr:hypothetical protein [Opitutaceae bacterium]
MTLPAFTKEQCETAKVLLASRVAYMMGRKLEEGDWAHVYCKTLGIRVPEWSNLNADLTIPGLSLEHKMMRCSESQPIQDHCGTDMMHPALTRRVSLPEKVGADEAMRIVIAGYQRVLDERLAKAAALSKGRPVELRSGWLLYESSLSEFLYWEEPTVNLNPKEHKAVWKERVALGEGGRRANKNLWIYNKATGRKVWSVTGGRSGTKIQPYFTVPAADDENLCYFRVQGEPWAGDTVRVWVTEPTARTLREVLGDLQTGHLSEAILNASAKATTLASTEDHERVHELVILQTAYLALKEKFPGVSDEHCFQLLCKRLVEKAR